MEVSYVIIKPNRMIPPHVFRKHVFHDLEPYICTIGECNEALSTFKSKREWAHHELTVNRGVYEERLKLSRCPLCFLTFTNPEKGLYRHLGRHLRELSLASLPPIDTPNDDENLLG